MADPYATIAEAPEPIARRLADVLELRAADLQQRAMLEDYLLHLPLPSGARLLEVGCGTGAIARALAERPGVGSVVGLDPSPLFIARARALGRERDRLSFEIGDGRALPFEDGSFDAVVCHTSLCHIPGPELVLAEAARVVAEGAWLAVFDGDYATATVATSATDPLQTCVDAAIEALVHDRWLVRRLPVLARDAGWSVVRLRSHGYVESDDPGYTLTLIDRGADALAAQGRLGPAAAESLKAEARERAAQGRYFGHIAYASLVARRSAASRSRE